MTLRESVWSFLDLAFLQKLIVFLLDVERTVLRGLVHSTEIERKKQHNNTTFQDEPSEMGGGARVPWSLVLPGPWSLLTTRLCVVHVR